MMTIPNIFPFQKKYGILVTDSEVTLVSWVRGELERIALFSNDEAGLENLQDFFAERKDLNDKPFHVMVNIIGEDYRLEKIAHLIGKYRADFHEKRMRQLFRGSQFFMSEVQGREERGRREDWVLFSGVLTEGKVLPWVNEATRGGRFLGGVHMVSFALAGSIIKSVDGAGAGNNLLLTIHEQGFLRQTFFVNGHLRFSRVSKINDRDAQTIGDSVKKELDRTLQYLGSLKISIGNGLDVRMICPSSMVSQLRETVAGTERIRFHFYDVAAVASRIGLKGPIAKLGHDSSLPLQVMFSWMANFKQLARPKLVSYFYAQTVTTLAVLALAVYGVFAYWAPISYVQEGYFDHREAIARLQVERSELQRQYDGEVKVSGKPPSSSENMRAVSEFYSVVDNLKMWPTQLLYYIGNALAKNSEVRLDKVDWHIANTPEGSATEGLGAALVNGEDLYQIATIEGELTAVNAAETYRDVYARAQNLLDSFQKRDDVHVEVVEFPPSQIDTANLSGSLEDQNNLEAPTTRKFVIRVIWKGYDKESLARLARVNDQR